MSRSRSALLGPLMALALPALLILGGGLAAASPAAAEGKSIIVLDGSGSMWGQIGGRPKLEIAREALGEVLNSIPAETELGLMAYGHREKGSCEDIEMMVPPAAGTAAAIADAAGSMRFLGKTPLSEAVRRAAAELRSTEEKATVILITDGIETCNADPCALGRELEASGVDFTAHVVGFGLTQDEGRQVACLAENTGGRYIEAKDARTLVDALQSTVAEAQPVAAPEPAPPEPTPAPTPQVVEFNLAPVVRLAADGPAEAVDFPGSVEVYTRTADGSRGEMVAQQYGLRPMSVDPGSYVLVVDQDEVMAETEVTVTADATAQPELVLNAGYLTLRPVTEAGGDVVDGSSVTLRSSDREVFHYGEATRLLPAGAYDYVVAIGNGTIQGQVTVEAGKSVTQDAVVAVGVAVINTFYVPGMAMEDSGQWIEIFAAKTALDGSRKSINGGYGTGLEFTLPPGDYLAYARKDEAEAELPFTVRPNERAEVAVVLNAGVLAVSAPGARSIELFAAAPAIDGSRKSIRFEYGETINLTFPPGAYLAVADYEAGPREAPATVAAGERTEVTIAAP